jgi:hypothetical protein
MASYDFEHAKAFFKAKAGFTTGLHEVDGMIKQGEDIVIVDVRPPARGEGVKWYKLVTFFTKQTGHMVYKVPYRRGGLADALERDLCDGSTSAIYS